MIRDKLRIVQHHQKCYANCIWRELHHEVGDMVFLKVSSSKGIIRFSKKGKLSLIYIGLFEILEKLRTTAYRLVFPLQLPY